MARQVPGVQALALAVRKGDWLKVQKPVKLESFAGLDIGECAAICLAERLYCPLLVDERRARMAARKREILVIGTGRILLEAKERALIPSVTEILKALQKQGYRLSDRLCRRLAELAGEDPL